MKTPCHPFHQTQASRCRGDGSAWSRAIGVAARALATLWILCGLMICSETLPDVVGDSHAHAKGHPMDLWHGEPGEEDHPDSGPQDHFHCHVVHDFSSVETGTMSFARPVILLVGMLAPVGGERLPVPDGPCLEVLEPPLV